MSTLLAFDTATEHMSIALRAGAQVWIHEGLGGAQASTTLIPRIQQLLAQAGVALHRVDAVAFGQGPGAFTGLRTACAVAQGLAFGADKPVLCIDTLMVVAEAARAVAGIRDVWVLMDARMGEVYAAHYLAAPDADGASWTTSVAPALYELEALNDLFDRAAPRAVAGTAVDAFGERLRTGSALRIEGAWPRASALMAIAEADWRRGVAVDAAQALPLYVRDKVALTTVERDAAKAAKAAAAQAVATAKASTP